MQRTTNGSLWLFRAFQVDVYVHWSWFLIAFYQISSRPSYYENSVWKIIEYVSLFGIVLLHEFGHALACRSMGGKADTIVLWPLGGIAFVAPPARPGALLWSIVAGPLVNLVLAGPLIALALLVPEEWSVDLHRYLGFIAIVNVGLFVFNMLPIYPLDGGQILFALLWYPLGRWKSLQIVSAIGLVFGLGAFLCLVLLTMLGVVAPGNVLILGLICLFVAFQSAASFQSARHVQHIENLPRHADCACPGCFTGPPQGQFWLCEECGARFDKFETRGKCPACGAWFLLTQCQHCGQQHHIDRWFAYRPGVGPRPIESEDSPP